MKAGLILNTNLAKSVKASSPHSKSLYDDIHLFASLVTSDLLHSSKSAININAGYICMASQYVRQPQQHGLNFCSDKLNEVPFVPLTPTVKTSMLTRTLTRGLSKSKQKALSQQMSDSNESSKGSLCGK